VSPKLKPRPVAACAPRLDAGTERGAWLADERSKRLRVLSTIQPAHTPASRSHGNRRDIDEPVIRCGR